MPSGEGILANARKHIGEVYDHDRVPKDDAGWSGPWDCAEFASWLVYQEGQLLYGCEVGATDPAKAEAHTGFWKRDAAQRGRRIPVEEAAATPGAFLLRYPPDGQPMGHIVVSDGKGGTVEAMDRARGVTTGKVANRRWDTGVLIPGFEYGTAAVPVPVPGPGVLYARGLPNMNPEVVRTIQRALAAAGFDPGASGVFDEATAAAVFRFQNARGIVTDGEVGETTAKLLGVPLDQLAGAVAGVAVKGVLAGNPLLAVAMAAAPAIARMLARDPESAAASKVSQAVAEVAGTSEPAAAQARIEASPALQADLQYRLAEIAEAQDAARRAAEAAERRDAAAAEATRRDDEMKALQARLDDVQKAREAASQRAREGGPMAIGPLFISGVVTIGFFAILLLFIYLLAAYRGEPLANENRDMFQIINIAIGALTVAFSTVVTFWLGSSDGSRRKDREAADAREREADQTQKLVAENRTFTETLMEKAANQPTPIIAPGAAPAAGARGSNFQRCVDLVLDREGGFSNHKDDNGGATKFGITQATLRDFRGEPVTVQDVRNLKVEEAREIYRSRYWNILRCDDLPPGVDLVVFDFGVNAGPGRAARLLQEIVRADVDGSVGDQTLGLVASVPVGDIVDRFSERRLAYYKRLDDWAVFGDGWTNRTNIIRNAALAMLRPSAAAA